MATVYAVSLAAIVLAGISLWMTTRRRRKSIKPAPAPSTTDMHVKAVYGIRLPEWDAMTDDQRAKKRANVALYLNQENP